MSNPAMDGQPDLQQWIGRRESAVDMVTPSAVARIAALLDRDDPEPRMGDLLPVGWHGVFCPSVVRHSELGPDGHPKRGPFIPPFDLPRRMAAGTRMTFHEPLKIGDEVRRVSEVKALEKKQGHNGELCFLTLESRYSGPRGLAAQEEQKAVFLGVPEAPAAPSPKVAVTGPADWEKTVVPDAVMVFRYAALGFSSHRIHYDAVYAREHEGYPAVISSAGLNMLLMFDAARENFEKPVTSFSCRNIRPVLLDRPIRICGALQQGGTGGTVWIVDQDGAVAVSAKATLS